MVNVFLAGSFFQHLFFLKSYTVRRLYFGTLEVRFMFSLTFWKLRLAFNLEQDGPSLESSSYLNVTLRYVCPLDLVTVGPWVAWTS